MTSFICENLDLTITFDDKVIDFLSQFRQIGYRMESGGMLFSEEIDTNQVVVNLATPPTKLDLRNRFGFKHHVNSSQEVINNFFNKGLHYLGDWHSHPQPVPIPSQRDNKTIKDVYLKSEHKLNFVLMLIIGTGTDFSKNYLGLANEVEIYSCQAV